MKIFYLFLLSMFPFPAFRNNAENTLLQKSKLIPLTLWTMFQARLELIWLKKLL